MSRQLHEALKWTRQAAADGRLPAQRSVDQLHLTDLDTMGQDLQEARTWLGIAASRGDRESRRLLPEVDRALRPVRDHALRLRLHAARTAAWWGSAPHAGCHHRPYGGHGGYGWW